MPIKVYQYPKCDTCRKALKFLNAHDVKHQAVDITLNPPSSAELKKMLAHQNGEIRKLFNTSGQLYRELKISEKLKNMTDDEAITLLSKHGKLIKRPFVLTEKSGLIGFNEPLWSKTFK